MSGSHVKAGLFRTNLTSIAIRIPSTLSAAVCRRITKAAVRRNPVAARQHLIAIRTHELLTREGQILSCFSVLQEVQR